MLFFFIPVSYTHLGLSISRGGNGIQVSTASINSITLSSHWGTPFKAPNAEPRIIGVLSPVSYTHLARSNFSSGEGSDSPFGVILPIRISPGSIRAPTPVSYTHLDVYKRQVSTRTVHFINVTNTRHIVFISLTPYGFWLRFNTKMCIRDSFLICAGLSSGEIEWFKTIWL